MIVGARLIHRPVFRWDRPEEVGDFLVPVPPGWRYRYDLHEQLTAFEEAGGLRVLVSVMVEQDEQQWLHVSLSRHDRMPTYRDMCRVKRDFIGPKRKAVQIFAPESEHISDHPYCLHLWCCLTADPLPDFTRGKGTI